MAATTSSPRHARAGPGARQAAPDLRARDRSSSDATVAGQAPDRCLTCLDGEARGPQEGGASLLMDLADEARTRATGTSSTARSTAREVTPGRRFRALR